MQKTLVKRDSGTPGETVMDREIRNVLEGEQDKRLLLTESKASMFVEENTKDTKDKMEAKDVKDEENAKFLFEQVEELLDNASWQHLLQHSLQNF